MYRRCIHQSLRITWRAFLSVPVQISRSGHGQDPIVIQYHLTPLPGERDSFCSVKKGCSFSHQRKAWWAKGLSTTVFHCWAFCMQITFSLYTSITNTSAVIACFIIVFLFPAKCSYLNPWSLPFLFPTGRGEGEGFVVFFLLEVLNWRIPFLSHDAAQGKKRLLTGSSIFVSRKRVELLEVLKQQNKKYWVKVK